MHGGHLVEELRLHDLQARLEQLGTDHHGHAAAEQEGTEAEPQVEGADVRGVGGQYPARQAPGGAVVVMHRLTVVGHCVAPASHVPHSGAWLKASTSGGGRIWPTLLPSALRS